MEPNPEPGNYFEDIDNTKLMELDLQYDDFPNVKSVDNKWIFSKMIKNKHFYFEEFSRSKIISDMTKAK